LPFRLSTKKKPLTVTGSHKRLGSENLRRGFWVKRLIRTILLIHRETKRII